MFNETDSSEQEDAKKTTAKKHGKHKVSGKGNAKKIGKKKKHAKKHHKKVV